MGAMVVTPVSLEPSGGEVVEEGMHWGHVSPTGVRVPYPLAVTSCQLLAMYGDWMAWLSGFGGPA